MTNFIGALEKARDLGEKSVRYRWYSDDWREGDRCDVATIYGVSHWDEISKKNHQWWLEQAYSMGRRHGGNFMEFMDWVLKSDTGEEK